MIHYKIDLVTVIPDHLSYRRHKINRGCKKHKLFAEKDQILYKNIFCTTFVNIGQSTV